MRCGLLLTSLSLLLPLACGVESDPSMEAPGSGGKVDSPTLVTKLPAGSYLLELTSRSEIWDAQQKEMLTPRTRILAHARSVVEDDAQLLSIEPCRVELPRLGKHQPVLPDATVQRLPALSLALSAEAVGADDEAAWRLSSALGAITLGARLDDPLHDPLPVEEDDASVFDQEGDGDPGVTVKVGYFSIYMAARVRLQLIDGRWPRQAPVDGGLATRPTIDGELYLSLDQQILDDSVPFYDVAKAVAEAAESYQVLTTEHRFHLSPRQEQSCAALLEGR